MLDALGANVGYGDIPALVERSRRSDGALMPRFVAQGRVITDVYLVPPPAERVRSNGLEPDE